LLFTIHPVHTEVVANIKANGDLLSILFSILSLRLVWSYGQKPHVLTLLGSTLLFFVALLFKETAVSTVGLAGLVLYFFSKLEYRKIGLALLPLFAAVAAYLLICHQVFGSGAHSLEVTTPNLSDVILRADGWSQEVGLRLYALGKNLQLLVFPNTLLMMYVCDRVPMVEFYEMESLFPLALYTIMGIVFIKELLKRCLLKISLDLILISLFLFSNILISIPNIISERWLLPPSLGICLLLAQLWQRLLGHSRITAIVTLSLICFGFSGYTWQRNTHWKNNLTLARADIKKAPTNYNITRMMASEFHFAAKANEMGPKLLQESAHYYRQMLRAIPEGYYTRNNLGLIYEALGQNEMAALEFSKVILHDSEIRGAAKYSYAKNQSLAENYTKALEMLDELELEYPNSSGVKELKATALKSAQHYETWLMQTPNKPEEHDTLGLIYEHLRKHDAAARHSSEAARQPNTLQGKAAFSAAKNLALAGDHEAAFKAWLELESRYPTVPEVAFNKAETLKKLGKDEPAIKAYTRTVNIIREMPLQEQERYQELIEQANTATSTN
jgi:Flp pilus assembly protein TadD